MRAHPGVAVVGGQLRTINAQGEDQGPLDHYPLEHAQIVQQMLRSNPMGHPSIMFRCKEVLAAGNYRDFSPTHVEDYDLWLRMAAMNFRLANLPDALVHYRMHERSTTQKSIAAHRLDAEMLRRLQETAPQLYGCSGESIERLKLKKHPFAVIPLLKIARHLRGENSAWHSEVFYRAARELVAPRDLLSRVIVATAGGGPKGGLREIGAVASDLLRSASRLGR
jgi:DNA-binding transcriptional MerR regulator